MNFISPDNEYPRHYGDIMLAVPGWEFGDELPEGWHAVEQTQRPTPGSDEIVFEDKPKLVSGKYVQQWGVRAMTAEEIERRDAPITARQKLVNAGLTQIEIEAIANGMVK
jgi:hypothetical protein